MGKTVMLNEFEDAFHAAGWLSVGVSATSTLVPDLARRVSGLLRQHEPPPRRRLTGVSLPGGVGADWENIDPQPADLRMLVTRLLDVLGPDRGLLLTIDEIHGGQREQMREIATMSQHLVREDRQFALAMAGLPSSVSNLLSDHVLTFLRRADRHDLRSLPVDDVEDALRHTVEANGRSITHDASLAAAEATEGYPFMVQLVGHQMWRATDGPEIDSAAVARGVPVAKRRLRELVHETALNDLSDVDREFLVAMAVDDGPSSTAEVARRMGRSSQYVNTYRGRLMAAGVIEAPARGKVDLSIPYLRETLRELN
ncbi:ATP-binding protein [Nocardioides dilutus]